MAVTPEKHAQESMTRRAVAYDRKTILEGSLDR